MKKIPKIIVLEKMIPPKKPEEQILYIGHYGFLTNLKPIVIRYHPNLDKHELYEFQIETVGCHTHLSSDPYVLENKLSKEKFEQLISDELYNWLELHRPIQREEGFTIREWNEELWFNRKGNNLKNLEIDCPGVTSSNSKPWINIYDCSHIEGKNFKIKVLDYNKNKTRIKLKIKGMYTKEILFIGWFPLEYIDPRVWVEEFFKDVKKKKILTVYAQYFKRNLIDKSPQWNQYKGDYRERTLQIAESYGVDGKIEVKKEGQDEWTFEIRT